MGFGLMVGCMVGSSLAMAPAMLVAQGAAYTDLDGPLLLAEDRANPLRLRRGPAFIRPRAHSGDERMSRIVYVNGDYLPEDDAKISIFDRGFLMADGVYEVTSVLGGKLIDFAGHAVRLQRVAVANWTWPPRSAMTNCWRSTANWSRATASPRAWSICRSPAATPATAISPFPTRP